MKRGVGLKVSHPEAKKGGCQWKVAFGRGGTRPLPAPAGPHAGRGGISIQRHVADLQVKILSKDTFKIGVAILRSLLRDRYPSASRSEQRQLYSTVSRVATILTTQFTGEEYWTAGLSLFKMAKRVITEVDELMHIRACIDLAHKFLGDDRQRKEVFAAAATVSAGSSVVDSITKRYAPDVSTHPAVDALRSTDDVERPIAQPQAPNSVESELQSILKGDRHGSSVLEMEVDDHEGAEEEKKEELRSLPNHGRSHSEPKLESSDDSAVRGSLEPEFPEEDPDMRLARILTMEELRVEIQAILHRVNQTFTGRSQALADEFLGLQEAIQATLQEINNALKDHHPHEEEIEKLSIVVVTKHVLARLVKALNV